MSIYGINGIFGSGCIRASNYAKIMQGPFLPVPTVVMLVPQFSIPVVHKELSSPDISKGAGPDDIHLQMVRWLADFFA